MVTWVYLVPAITAVLLFFLPKDNTVMLRLVALLGSVVAFVLACGLLLNYTVGASGFQEQQSAPWIRELHVGYHVGVDGVSLILILLTTIVVPTAIYTVTISITHRIKEFLVLMLVLEASVIGVFVALDLVLFYFFWEGMLIPTYFLIGVWGGQRRIYAALKYILYTMTGSLLMLVGIIGVFVFARTSTGAPLNTFDLVTLTSSATFSADVQVWLFIAFGLAFAIKAALFPLHTWLPDVYAESALPVTIVVSAVLSKMGIYGFLRFCLPLFPTASHRFAGIISFLALISIIYGALLVLGQRDIKRLVACTSISHLGFITLGVFAFTQQSIQGATLQMLNHGIIIAALFLIVGLINRRWGSTKLADLGGFANGTPVLAAVFLLVTLAALGLPGLNGFVGEFLILIGVFQNNPLYASLATIGVILASAYMLRFFQGVMHGPGRPSAQGATSGPVEGAQHKSAADLAAPARGAPDLRSPAEWPALLPLVVLIVWIGVAPASWLNPIQSSVDTIISQSQR